MKTGWVSRNILRIVSISQHEPRSVPQNISSCPSAVTFTVTKRRFMSLTKFINIFVSRLPPHPSTEIALTKLYRLYVEADDLFFFLAGKLFPRSWELHCSLPSTPLSSPWLEQELKDLLLDIVAESELWNFIDYPWVGAGNFAQLQEPPC